MRVTSLRGVGKTVLLLAANLQKARSYGERLFRGEEVDYERLDRDFYEPRVATLTTAEQEFYRIRKGEYGYTAPRFRDFLLRRSGGPVAGSAG